MLAENSDCTPEFFIDLEEEETAPKKRRVGGTNLALLVDAQEFLRKLVQNKVPNSLLATSWDEFYCLYDDLIRRFVFAQGVPKTDVDDCVQDVWTEIASRLDSFDRPPERPGLRAWLFTLVRNKAVDVFRQRSRSSAKSLEADGIANIEPVDRDADPAIQCEHDWEQAVLDGIISQMREELSSVNARLVQMRLTEHRSVNEVASELGLKPEHVHARQHRIMKKLRARVALFTGDPLGS